MVFNNTIIGSTWLKSTAFSFGRWVIGYECAYVLSRVLNDYISERFGKNCRTSILVLLSVSYALCQYNIAQSSNIMWLDGVYMLPLNFIINKFWAFRSEDCECD